MFPTEMWNADISSVTLLKRDSTIETFQVVLKILGTLVENICRGVSFQFKTNSIKDVFLEVFKTANFQNNSFCERPLKRVWNNFYLKRLILDSNSATLIKWLYYRPLLGKCHRTFRPLLGKCRRTFTGSISLGVCFCWSQKFRTICL